MKTNNLVKDINEAHDEAFEINKKINETKRPTKESVGDILDGKKEEININQRNTKLLDFIRRGKLIEGIEIMSEMVNTFPDLIKNGKLPDDLTYEEVKSKVIADTSKLEKTIINEDNIIAKKLGNGFEKSNIYLTYKWYNNNLIKEFNQCAQIYNKVKDSKNPQSNESFLEKKNKDIFAKLSTFAKEYNLDITEIKNHFDKYVLNKDSYLLQETQHVFENDLQKEIYDKIEKYYKYPKFSSYKGEKLEKVPDFSDIIKKKGIEIIVRDEVPNVKGGLIIDGNFGYDEDGNLIIPNDKEIIDHHDKLESKTYDTATIMAYRDTEKILKMNSKDRKQKIKTLHNENDKLITMVNHIDSDSILSLWVLRNPNKAKKYEKIVSAISTCGDFLLGSGLFEYGATARDYEYIIRYYLDEVSDKVKENRTINEKQILEDNKLNLDDLKNKKAQLDNEILSIEIKSIEVSSISDKIEKLKNDNTINGKDKGLKLKELQNSKQVLLKQIIGEEKISAIDKINKDIKTIEDTIKNSEKLIKEISSKPISNNEKGIIMTHMLDTVEDIIKNPFKYEKYISIGREKEERTIKKVGDDVNSGKITLSLNNENPDLLIMKDGKGGDCPRYESLDGLYFFFRQNYDLNKNLIMSVNKQSYSLAINTQNGKDLVKYEFNKLIDIVREKESYFMNIKLDEYEKKLIDETLSKEEKLKIEKEKKILLEDIKDNKECKLWRNRTQMIFSFKSYIPENEFISIVNNWRDLHNKN